MWVFGKARFYLWPIEIISTYFFILRVSNLSCGEGGGGGLGFRGGIFFMN